MPMVKDESFLVAGVDGCKGGWLVAIAEVNANKCVVDGELFVETEFQRVMSRTEDCKVVCVDIPIGLSERNRRICDEEAKEILENRQCCIFHAPIRRILDCDNYNEANEASRRLTGYGLSRQSFGIMKLIRQVDYAMTPEMQRRVREIHPEVCFLTLNGHKAVRTSKRSEAGQTRRRQLLEGVLNGVDECLQRADMRGYAIDDVYDALVAAYTAGQVALGKYETLPERPETDNNGLRMEIVYPTGDS
jgi:predicted RNase H-like nuclease